MAWATSTSCSRCAASGRAAFRTLDRRRSRAVPTRSGSGSGCWRGCGWGRARGDRVRTRRCRIFQSQVRCSQRSRVLTPARARRWPLRGSRKRELHDEEEGKTSSRPAARADQRVAPRRNVGPRRPAAAATTAGASRPGADTPALSRTGSNHHGLVRAVKRLPAGVGQRRVSRRLRRHRTRTQAPVARSGRKLGCMPSTQ
jgi:hypothetical protein